jgi:GINS complex subunit 2
MRTSVPLWLALLLKKQGKCAVVPPRWLDAATLRTVIESERADDVFQGLPHHYIEIATDLCKYAREDLEDWNTLYDLVDTIRSVRHNKIQAGLRSLDENALKGVKLTNMSAMEVSVIRPFMSNALDNFLEGSMGTE